MIALLKDKFIIYSLQIFNRLAPDFSGVALLTWYFIYTYFSFMYSWIYIINLLFIYVYLYIYTYIHMYIHDFIYIYLTFA